MGGTLLVERIRLCSFGFDVRQSFEVYFSVTIAKKKNVHVRAFRAQRPKSCDDNFLHFHFLHDSHIQSDAN